MSGRKPLTEGKTGPKRNGQNIACMQCGKLFYRDRAYIERTKKMTCSRACYSLFFRGENNPFWNKTHTDETRKKISEFVKANPSKGSGPKKGVFKHTPETRALMSQKLRERWKNNREVMMKNPRKKLKPREELRYRRCFSRKQRLEWSDSCCAWCDATEDLVLDHIIPVMCGGTNERKNAQTLCRTCNLWKMVYVDKALHLAGLDLKVG